MGNKKAPEKLQAELDANPLTLCGKRMKQFSAEKYLGDQLTVSLSESVAATVNKRIGVATHAIFEIRTVVDDCRSEVVGGQGPGGRSGHGGLLSPSHCKEK